MLPTFVLTIRALAATRCSSLLVLVCSQGLATAAIGQATYELTGDHTLETPGACGTIVSPGSVNGTAVVGDGPELLSLELVVSFVAECDATVISGIPGSTITLDYHRELGPAGNHAGTGTTSSTINWGAVPGWTYTGRLICTSYCPGGCPGTPPCEPFVGFEGSGPLADLQSTAFNSDPWAFTTDSEHFTASEIEIVNLFGAVTEDIVWSGTRAPEPAPVPIGPLAPALTGAALLALGLVGLRRRLRS